MPATESSARRAAGRVAGLRDAAPRRFAFAGVFGGSLLVFLAVGAVLPVLPRYVRGPLGEGDVWVGVITGGFALSAIVARPIAGRLADRRGRRAILVAGALLAAAAGALYFLSAGVWGLLAARLVLGAGEGLVFTAGATWVLDLAPVERRGRVVGLFGLAIWGGLALGPLAGVGLEEIGGYEAVWAFAVLSPLCGALLARTVSDPHVSVGARAGGPLIPGAAVRPGLALALANLGYAAIAGFVVLHLDARDVGHGAAVFTAFAAAVVLTRLLAGRLPDVLGGRRMATIAFTLEALGLALLAAAGSLPVAVAAAILTGFGFSALFPSLVLLVVARVAPERRGAAIGGFTAFFDAGVALGGPLAGAVSALAGYPAAFWVAAGCAAAGTLVTLSVPPPPAGAVPSYAPEPWPPEPA